MPFDPWRLRAAGYEPVIRILRSALRAGVGIRVDHVIGLFRLFWIPEGAGPQEGGYVGYPWSDLLDILALESHRAGAYAVGEDLGTVAPFMREELAARDDPLLPPALVRGGAAARFPERALAAVTTHDLPTVAGLWTGADLEEQRRLGLRPNEAGTASIRDRLAERGRLGGRRPGRRGGRGRLPPAGRESFARARCRPRGRRPGRGAAERARTVDERRTGGIPLPLDARGAGARADGRADRRSAAGEPRRVGAGRQAGGVTSRQ